MPGSGISLQVDKPGKLVLANVLSRLMWALLLRKILPVLSRVVGHLWQGEVVSSEQVVEARLPRGPGWEYPGGTSPQNSGGPRASSALLSPFSASWTGQTVSELLLLFGTASEHCCSWCMQTLRGFGTGLLFLSKGSRKKSSKPKTQVGVF